MKLGAEPKKVVILGALLAVAALVLYFNVFAGDSPAPRPVATPAPAPVSDPVVIPATHAAKLDRKAAASRSGNVQEFKLRQGVEPGQPAPDPATIDPTLRLDLLAKVQKVEMPGQLRNIFQYGAAPPPPAPKPVELPKNVPKIAINQPPAPTGPPPPPPVPTAPPMTFKYYGYKISKADGHKQAFLLDGEDIIVAGENEDMKRGRYKIIRIGTNSITIEDEQFKSSQTLPLLEDAPGV
jgi:hypothetical protein